MQQRNVRYRAGPGGLVYVAASGMILAGAVYTQSNLLFWAFGLMTGAMFVSLLMSVMVLRRLDVQRLVPSQGVAGESLVLRYRIINHSWVPAFALLVGEYWPGRRWWRRSKMAGAPPPLRPQPVGWVLHLGPYQSAQAEAWCWPIRRGWLALEGVVLTCSFPFGVIRKTLLVTQPDAVMIYPRLHRIGRRLLYRAAKIDPRGHDQIDRPGGNEEFFGLRHYRTGDSLKMIDWKHSAKTGKLISRDMTIPAPPRIMLALDLRQVRTAGGTAKGDDDSDVLELAVSLAASLVCDSYLQGCRIGLTVWGARCPSFPMHHSLPHRTCILEALAKLDCEEQATGSLRSVTNAIEPTVIVRPGPSVAGGGVYDGRIIIGTDDMQQFVQQGAEPAAALLARRAPKAKTKLQEAKGTSRKAGV